MQLYVMLRGRRVSSSAVAQALKCCDDFICLRDRCMKHYYRNPMVEEGVSNIILQNRCGNRLTLLLKDGWTDLEFIYKPNAFRRRDFRARNFSNRDNFTTLFSAFTFPEINVDAVTAYRYDPFITSIDTQSASRAQNTLTLLNLPQENCFAIAARCPLLILIQPHKAFVIRDSLLSEQFVDRGEEVVSFVHFAGFEENRFRTLDDGRVVLQVMNDELILVGAEENEYQVNRIIKQYGHDDLVTLKGKIEQQLAPVLNTSVLTVNDADIQQAITLNKRIIYSGLDEGGACFGALNRMYHLIWVRDGAMTTSMMACAGLPELLRIWTPFLLQNPTRRRTHDGHQVDEFLQLVGTQWTKEEDDGIYYALLSLYTLYVTTGDQGLLHPSLLHPLLAALDYHIETRFKTQVNLFLSNTCGETTLVSSPFFGYDSVNGRMTSELSSGQYQGREIWLAGTLYHNVNLYNALRMSEILLTAGGLEDRVESYHELANTLQQSIQQQFIDPDGHFYAALLYFQDGTQVWAPFVEGDHWEYAWAVSMGPFFPDYAAALRSAQMVRLQWPEIRPYGYCPWNTVSRMLKEFGLSSKEYKAMLADEVNEAFAHTIKYPMRGALTEYWNEPEGWRALPFSAGSFMFTLTAQLLQSLPQGIAVRAADLVEHIDNFHYQMYRIDVTAVGEGDTVLNWTLNDQEVEATLQIPEQLLRMGRNTIEIVRNGVYNGFRFYSSNARLFSAEVLDGVFMYQCMNAIPSEVFFENYQACPNLQISDSNGNEIEVVVEALAGTNLTRVTIPCRGAFIITAW